MNILSKLPNLEVLKLKDHAFHGHIWKLSDEEEDGFSRLKFLLLEDMNLKQWEATTEQIQEEQQSMGSDDLIVRMHYLGQ
ncbi:hypothetical protein KY290_000028 [Solanum tuberosum]|uniref:Uncharacterized protein n=1 Tax=Solanum tuberosum TaxID=4113 RepID=A0ABQ7WI67_SOLTU|nr:hypothetical protein KY289_000032 [Solanum tuberosum]KAH0780430.1 hypothetical protein KY290_000028 [Solanum tuberosum]